MSNEPKGGTAMSEPIAPPEARTKAAAELADRYLALWNEPDADRRGRTIAELWTHDGRHFRPAAAGDPRDRGATRHRADGDPRGTGTRGDRGSGGERVRALGRL